MVYDPIRDIERPSPIAPSQSSLPWNQDTLAGRQEDEGSNGNGRQYSEEAPQYPSTGVGPAFPVARRSVSGGLKGLLNDHDEDVTRRGSGHTSSSFDEDHRPSIQRILNSAEFPTSATISQSNSASSFHPDSPSTFSPGIAQRYIEPQPLLTPSSSTSHHQSRTPYQINTSVSPGGYLQSGIHSGNEPYSPMFDYQTPGASSSRRRLSQSGGYPRPMLPPDTIPRQEMDYSRITPGGISHSSVLRSPSISLSPKSQQQLLPPHNTSRPTSSTSSQTFSFQPPPLPSESPSITTRKLSDHSRPTSSSSRRLSRRGSMIAKSPSPVKIPYDPNRLTEPTSLYTPITPEEIARLRSLAVTNNPLRRKKRKSRPSWSGTPPVSLGDLRGTPLESDESYFPNQAGPAGKAGSRRNSLVSAGRSATTPGAAMTVGPSMSSVPETGKPIKKPIKRRQSTMNKGDEDGHSGQRRKLEEDHFIGNSAVANHYNARPEIGVQARELSPIIGLKKFNNWIKSVLIGKFAFRQAGARGAKVLDIGCGKGGDLNKWKQARIQLYVGMDIADMSIDQARDRYRTMNRPGFDAHFFAWDCYSQSISEVLPDPLKIRDLYDNVTMQFCMHYAFESASKARMMIENVSRYLRKGGLFIGTIPDANLLLAKLEEVPEEADPQRFGNSCYFVEFTERRHKGLYGHAYRFFLQDAVEDVPEYTVNWENFVSLATEYKLRLVYKKAFSEVLSEEQSSRDFGPLLGKMGVLNERGESAMDADQWEAANLYMAFAFEKY